MMKKAAVTAFVVFAATLVVCDALLPIDHMIKRVKEARRAVNSLGRIVKRQSSDCLADFERYENDPTFVSCEAIAEEFEDNDVLSIDTVNRFCGKDCGNYLLKAFQKLTQDCDYIYTPDLLLEEYLQQSCQKGPGNAYCLVLWDKSYNASFYPSYYEQCLLDFDSSGRTCPESCRTAEQWINRKFGCCYRALLDYEEDDEYIDYYFGQAYWTACGNQEPQLCK